MEYFSEDNKIKRFGPRNMFAGDYNFRTNRRVFKVIRANALIEWFAKELDFEIVYLIRHPISQSLSCIERGHHCELAEYIEDARFFEQYLDKGLGDFIREILHTGSELTRFAAEWCLDNLLPLKKSVHEPSWLVLTYEKLVLKYEKTMGLLCDRLDLDHMERLFTRKTAPSFTTGRSGAQTLKKIINADSRYLVERWKQDVTEEMEKAVFEILDRFHIDAYRQGSVLPGKRFLHFKHPNGSLHV